MWTTNTHKWIIYGCCSIISITGILLLNRRRILSAVNKCGVSIVTHILQTKTVHSTAQDSVVVFIKNLTDDIKFKKEIRKFIEFITTDKNVIDNIKILSGQLLEDEQLMLQVSQFTAQIINRPDILESTKKFIINNITDENIQLNIRNMIINLSTDDHIKKSLINVLTNILQDPEMFNMIKINVVKLVTLVASDEELVINLRNFIINVLDDDTIRTLVTQTGVFTLSSPAFEEAGKNYLTEVATSAEVKEKLSELLSDTIITNVNDDTVQKEIHDMLCRSMSSEEIQSYGANSLSNVLKKSITPNWWPSSASKTDST